MGHNRIQFYHFVVLSLLFVVITPLPSFAGRVKGQNLADLFAASQRSQVPVLGAPRYTSSIKNKSSKRSKKPAKHKVQRGKASKAAVPAQQSLFNKITSLGRTKKLSDQMREKGVRLGDPVFIRIFKQEGLLELWMRSDGRFALFKAYRICKMSGHLGPKRAESDKQTPEGFYDVGRQQMKPDSAFYRAFNIGYPNAYDRAWGRTGSLIMVHGGCKSIGCFAMTDKVMGEIYLITDAALRKGQDRFQVHIFPFRMTAINMDRYKKHFWHNYWWNLKQGHDLFEKTLLPPRVSNVERLYIFEAAKGSKSVLRSTPKQAVSTSNAQSVMPNLVKPQPVKARETEKLKGEWALKIQPDQMPPKMLTNLKAPPRKPAKQKVIDLKGTKDIPRAVNAEAASADKILLGFKPSKQATEPSGFYE